MKKFWTDAVKQMSGILHLGNRFNQQHCNYCKSNYQSSQRAKNKLAVEQKNFVREKSLQIVRL